MTGPVDTLRRELRTRARVLAGDPLTIACSGAEHRLAFGRGGLGVLDHDLAGEGALTALGGPRVPCVAAAETWPRLDLAAVRDRIASPNEDWIALQRLPPDALAWRVAELLLLEFEVASPAPAAHAARLGLRILQPGGFAGDDWHAELARIVRSPRFDVGARRWSAGELDVLAASFVAGSSTRKGVTRNVRLAYFPQTNERRLVVLTRFADLLAPDRSYTQDEVDGCLLELSENPARIRRALVHAGLLQIHARGHLKLRR